MATSVTDAMTTFVDAWIPEFVKSMEMFTGRVIVSTEPPPSTDVPGGDEPQFWHSQSFTRSGAGRLWIGVPLTQCLAATAPAAEDDGERVALFREAVAQSLQSVAQVLATAGCHGLHCGTESGSEAPPASVPEGRRQWFRAGDVFVTITLRPEPTFEAVIAADPPETGIANDADADASALSPSLERFAGVELPVRVVLGRATMRVRDILKLTVGSLIDLDARPNEQVDVCVHDSIVARGDVVSIRGNYGVRIVDVMSQRDRLTFQVRGRRRVKAERPDRTQPVVH
jgi:flagellar motor switch protein FliN